MGRDISVGAVPSEEQGVQNPHQAPKPCAPVSEKVVPITPGCKKQWWWHPSKMEGCCSPRHPLKGPKSTLACQLTRSQGRAAAQKLERTHGEKWNSLDSGQGLERPGSRKLPLGMKVLAGTLLLCWAQPPSRGPGAGRCQVRVLYYLASTFVSPWWFPDTPSHPTSVSSLNIFAAFPHEWPI